jgi:conjugal transfer pilus assembly protein TraI
MYHVTVPYQSMFRKFGLKDRANYLPQTKQNFQNCDIPGLTTVQTTNALLAHHSGLLIHINELAGLSNAHFNRYYLTAIRHIARFVQQLPASEVHHHAGAGGMLTHTLEVCVAALKIRRSYLLSDTGVAEDIAAKHDHWTYAVFTAALCHDLAKVAVDQTVIIYDKQYKPTTWQPWQYFIDEQGSAYTTEFNLNRQYRLHEKATPLLIHRIIPIQGINWLTSDPTIFSQWLACLAGDHPNTAALGEIIRQADGQSVAANLGADGSRLSTVTIIPLHEKMLTALRYLIEEGELPLNRNGAAGWVTGDDCWLVSKRTVDAIREHLNKEGHSGIPTKNGRLFDVLQEHRLLIPCGDKAIWTANIASDDWNNQLTLIRMPVAKIWPNPARRPDEFQGQVIPIPNEKSTNETAIEQASREDIDEPNDGTIPLHTTTTADQATTDSVLVSTNQRPPVTQPTDNQTKQKNPPEKSEYINRADDPVDQFFQWLQQGIKTGTIKTNQPKARVHVVEEGVALMTPGIFQDFAQAHLNDPAHWADIQKKVLKKHWHVKGEKGLNVIKYQVTGASKKTTANVILFAELVRVFGSMQAPKCNPHLLRLEI